MNELKINNSFRNIPRIRGVYPSLSFASIFAFLSNSSFTISMWPKREAMNKNRIK